MIAYKQAPNQGEKRNRGAKLARRGLGEKNRVCVGEGRGAVDFVSMPPIGLLAIIIIL